MSVSCYPLLPMSGAGGLKVIDGIGLNFGFE